METPAGDDGGAKVANSLLTPWGATDTLSAAASVTGGEFDAVVSKASKAAGGCQTAHTIDRSFSDEVNWHFGRSALPCSLQISSRVRVLSLLARVGLHGNEVGVGSVEAERGSFGPCRTSRCPVNSTLGLAVGRYAAVVHLPLSRARCQSLRPSLDSAAGALLAPLALPGEREFWHCCFPMGPTAVTWAGALWKRECTSWPLPYAEESSIRRRLDEVQRCSRDVSLQYIDENTGGLSCFPGECEFWRCWLAATRWTGVLWKQVWVIGPCRTPMIFSLADGPHLDESLFLHVGLAADFRCGREFYGAGPGDSSSGGPPLWC